MTKEIKKYLNKMANHECGCAPSAGYFEELILEARKLIEIINQQSNE